MDPRDRIAVDLDVARTMLATLKRQHDEVLDASRSSNADDEHDPEGSTIAFEREQLVALLDQARANIDELVAARLRVIDGSYGSCESCGQPIGDERLDARPAARLCLDCASRARS